LADADAGEGRLRRNAIVMGATWALMAPFNSAVGAYSSLYFMELGASPLELGLIHSSYLLTLAVSRLLGGYLADRIGRRTLIIPMTAVYATSNLLFAWAKGVSSLFVAAVVMGLALMYQPAIGAIVMDSVPKGRRGRTIAILNTASEAASLMGPMLGGLAVRIWGLRQGVRILYVGGFAASSASALIRLMLVETVPRKPLGGLRKFVTEYLSALSLFRGPYGKLVLVESLSLSAYGAVWTFAQVFAVKYVGMAPELWGLANTLTGVVFLASNILWGHLADRFSPARVISASNLMGALEDLTLATGAPGREFSVLSYLAMSSLHTNYPAYFSMSASLIPPSHRAKLEALAGLLMEPASAAFSAVEGWVYGLSPRGTFVLASALHALSAAMAFTLLPICVSGNRDPS